MLGLRHPGFSLHGVLSATSKTMTWVKEKYITPDEWDFIGEVTILIIHKGPEQWLDHIMMPWMNRDSERKRRNGDTGKGHTCISCGRKRFALFPGAICQICSSQPGGGGWSGSGEWELCSVLLSAGLSNWEHKCTHMQ